MRKTICILIVITMCITSSRASFWDPITFADPNVKALCVANWDTNGDGELTEGEAAEVTNLGAVFRYNKTIKTFNEFQYFTGLRSVGSYAFYGCSGLTSITIPYSLEHIEYDAFSGCTGLTSVHIMNFDTWLNINFDNEESNPLYYAHHLFFGEEIKIINFFHEEEIKPYVFAGCSGLTSVYFGDRLKYIGDGAFYGCSGLTSITIDDSVEGIGDYAFYGCSSLTSVTIPNSMTGIGEYAFYGCSNLTSISIGKNVTRIGDKAFQKCNKLATVTFQCEEIGDWFSETSIREVVMTYRVTKINNKAFYGCSSLTSITLPYSVTNIGNYAFYGCRGLTSIDISSVRSIREYTFYGCSSLTSIDISRVRSIGEYAFYGCSGLTSIDIRSDSIGNYAFSGCSGLTSVTIPYKVKSIGKYAFSDCGLTSVIVKWIIPITIVGNEFGSSYSSNKPTIYIPKNSTPNYQNTNWCNYKLKEYPDTDVNQDGEIDVVDVVDIARYVLDTPSASFDVNLADLNEDGMVNVADAVVLVNEIAGDTSWAPRLDEGNNVSNDLLTLTENDNHSLSLQMEGDGRYTAFQFDLLLPADMDVMQLTLNSQRRHGHQLLYNKVSEGHYRVVALSTSNNEFKGISGELLNITLDDFANEEVRIENIHFVTPQGADVPFEAIAFDGSDSTTGVGAVDVSQPTDGRDKIYNMKGERLSTPQNGLIIIKGKKVIIK